MKLMTRPCEFIQTNDPLALAAVIMAELGQPGPGRTIIEFTTGKELMMNDYTDRDRAILWARQILQADFVVLDTETTGLEDDAEACQIGIVSKTGEVLFDQLIKPRQPIPGSATRLHGITNEMVKDAPGFEAIIPQIGEILAQPKQILIYNKDYDQRILIQSAEASGLNPNTIVEWWVPPRDWSPANIRTGDHPNRARWHCVMEWFAQFYGDWNNYYGSYRWQKLTTAAMVLDIQIEAAHSAAGDALLTLKVVEGMAKSNLGTERS